MQGTYSSPCFAVLLGPLQATGYLLQHGCAAWALGSLWAAQIPWLPSILLSSLVRMGGIITFLAFTSWTLNENVYRLLITKIASLLVWHLPILLTVAPAY